MSTVIRSTISVKQNLAQGCENHHANIQRGQFVFIKKTPAHEDMGYDCYAANLSDVNSYIRMRASQRATRQNILNMNQAMSQGGFTAFINDENFFEEDVIAWIPWGVSMTDVIRDPNQGFDGTHKGGLERRLIVVAYLGKECLSPYDISLVGQANANCRLYLEIHWKPIQLNLSGTVVTLYVPQFQIVPHTPCQPIPNKAPLTSNYMYFILRWELGDVFFNTNTALKPIRQRVANMHSGTSQTLVEVNLECPRFSFFSTVPTPMSIV